jgi:diaminopimelate epimerase
VIEFFRLSGAGNDFIALAEPERSPTPEEMRSWCRRGVSLGADGVFVLRREVGGVEMRHFNADGGATAFCLNGARCAATLAFALGWATGTVTLRTGAGDVVACSQAPGRVAVDAPLPVDGPTPLEVEVGGRSRPGWRVTVGVPHLVLPWTGPLAEAPLTTDGRQLRHHPAFAPQGANIHFVSFTDPHRMSLRSFERGVEAETLACGSGALAAVAAGVVDGRLELPVTVETAGGFPLEVEGRTEGGVVIAWTLAGDARLLVRGRLDSAAAAAGHLLSSSA